MFRVEYSNLYVEGSSRTHLWLFTFVIRSFDKIIEMYKYSSLESPRTNNQYKINTSKLEKNKLFHPSRPTSFIY